MINKGLKKALKLVLAQMVVVTVVSILLYVLLDFRAFWSSLVGGGICIFANLLFAVTLFFYQGANRAKQIVKCFYLGEALKLFLVFLSFALILNFVHPNAFAMFVAFIVALLVNWVALLFLI